MPEPNPPEIADYELIKVIGSGSFGQVWLARSVTGLWRAIKHIQPDAAGTTRLIERELAGITRFQQNVPGEPRQLALLHVGRMPDGGFYYVMELADDASGSAEVDPDTYVPLTLKEMQLRRPHLPAREALRLSIEMARALDGLHRRQLVHRDIKPSNIIFVQGVPKLADVGLVSSSDTFMTSVGTRDFLPPEGAGLPSGDIYSFGKVLYELVIELPAREFPRLPASIRQRADWPLLRRLNQVIRQASETDPAQRPSHASVLLNLLEAIPADGELQVLRERLTRLARRSTVALAIAGCLIALLASWAAWTSRELARQERLRREQAEEEEQASRYSADLRGVVNALTLGDHDAARVALERQQRAPRDLRGFEWYALQQEFRNDSIEQHFLTNAQLQRLYFAAEGGWVARGSDSALYWTKPGSSPQATPGKFLGLAGISADGQFALARATNGQWRSVSISGAEQPVPTVADHWGQRWPGNWALLVDSGPPFRFQIWNLASSTLHAEIDPGPDWSSLTYFNSTLDGEATRLAANFVETKGLESRYWIGVWDIPSGQTVRRWVFDPPVYFPTLSRDGRQLAVTDRLAGIALYDISSGQQLRRFAGHLSRIDALAFSSTGRWLASAGGDRLIRIWDLEGTNEPIVLRGCTGPVSDLAWTPDDRSLWATSDDYHVRRFKMPESSPPPHRTRQIYGDERYGDLVFSPDGRLAAYTRTNRTVEVAQLPNLLPVGECPDIFQPLSCTAEGDVVGFGPDWSVRRQRPGKTGYQELAPPVWLQADQFVQSYAVDPLCQQLLIGAEKGQVISVSLTKGAYNWNVTNHEGYVTAVVCSHDGKWLATGGDDQQIQLLNLRNGERLETFHADTGVQRLVFSPDDRELIVARRDPALEVWTLATRQRRQVLRGHNRYAYGLAFVDGGRRLVSAGTDGTLVFWRRPDYRRIAEIPYFVPIGNGGDQSVFELKATAAGDTLALLTQDGRLRWWTHPASGDSTVP